MWIHRWEELHGNTCGFTDGRNCMDIHVDSQMGGHVDSWMGGTAWKGVYVFLNNNLLDTSLFFFEKFVL